MEITTTKPQRDFYFSLKQAELYHLLNEDDAHPGFIERKTVFEKAYTCVVDTASRLPAFSMIIYWLEQAQITIVKGMEDGKVTFRTIDRCTK